MKHTCEWNWEADPDVIKNAGSETAKYRHLTQKYCFRSDGMPGTGVDVASGGDTVVPWAMSLELPVGDYARYNSNHPARGPIHVRGVATQLPFEDRSLDFVYASHILEDYRKDDRCRIVAEWARCVRPGGFVIILVPEVRRWNHAIYNLGQPPNCAHSAPEPSLGDLTACAPSCGLEVVEERLAECYPNDYSILFVGRRV